MAKDNSNNRIRFRNAPEGVYVNDKSGKVIVVNEKDYYLGHVRIRQGKYRYAVWRQGDKLKEKYLGKLE